MVYGRSLAEAIARREIRESAVASHELLSRWVERGFTGGGKKRAQFRRKRKAFEEVFKGHILNTSVVDEGTKKELVKYHIWSGLDGDSDRGIAIITISFECKDPHAEPDITTVALIAPHALARMFQDTGNVDPHKAIMRLRFPIMEIGLLGLSAYATHATGGDLSNTLPERIVIRDHGEIRIDWTGLFPTIYTWIPVQSMAPIKAENLTKGKDSLEDIVEKTMSNLDTHSD